MVGRQLQCIVIQCFNCKLLIADAKKFKEIFEKSLKDIERIIGKKGKDLEQNENQTLSNELAKLKVASEKKEEEYSKKTVNGNEDDDCKTEDKILEGKESEDN